jgi:hypothetical protein
VYSSYLERTKYRAELPCRSSAQLDRLENIAPLIAEASGLSAFCPDESPCWNNLINSLLQRACHFEHSYYNRDSFESMKVWDGVVEAWSAGKLGSEPNESYYVSRRVGHVLSRKWGISIQKLSQISPNTLYSKPRFRSFVSISIRLS